jgi:hypothetical protein
MPTSRATLRPAVETLRLVRNGASDRRRWRGDSVPIRNRYGYRVEWRVSGGAGLFQKAQLLAKQNPDGGYPFLTVAGEVETLIKEAHYQKAEDLVQKASTQATQSDKLIKLTQLMLFDADIALGEKQPQRAIQILQKTIPLARRNQTRMLADAGMATGSENYDEPFAVKGSIEVDDIFNMHFRGI